MEINKTEYLGGKQASEILGVHQRTLYVWEKNKKIETIRTPGGKRLYNVNKYMKNNGITCINLGKNKIKEIKCIKTEDLDKLEKKNKKLKICYARVSTLNQKDDLERQKIILKEKYPDNILVEDIGSGINLTKRGILKIIDLGIKGLIEELVIVHKDRLARFGYDLIEYIIEKYSNGKIKIINEKKEVEPEEEMVEDVLQIMNVFVAKMNGRRKYKNKEIVKNK
jgi:predicted site-specific integrase-resolvase